MQRVISTAAIVVIVIIAVTSQIVLAATDDSLIDNGDDTITDLNTGLMWTKMDSYSDLSRCMNWYQAKRYVSRLKTGDYTDWRMPTIDELKTIYNEDYFIPPYDNDEKFQLRLSPVFSSFGAYWYWSSESSGECCKLYMYFSNGSVSGYFPDNCSGGGVRAVRNVEVRN